MARGSIVAGCLAPHRPTLSTQKTLHKTNRPPKVDGSNCDGAMNDFENLFQRSSTTFWSFSRHIGKPMLEPISLDYQTLRDYRWILSSRICSVTPNLDVDVELSKAIHDKAADAGLAVKMMENPDFRVDYGTITTGHMVNPAFDKPLVVISSNRSRHYYSVEVMQEMMMELGRVTKARFMKVEKKPLCLLPILSLIVISQPNPMFLRT